MGLLDALLKTDIVKFETPEEGTFYSKRLQKATGSDKPVAVRYKEMPAKRLNEIVSMPYDKKGRIVSEKAIRANAILVSEAVIDPDLKNEKLREHFGCETPADLAIKLFENEVVAIADAVLKLSGMTAENPDDEEDDELKNS